MAKIKVTQIHSAIGTKPNQRKNLRALGLRKISASRVHDDNKIIRGIIEKVHHLVSVEVVK